MPRKPYEQRTELEKVQSQWDKLSGLHTREEWSAAIVRAATAAEMAANFAIRAEFSARSQFDADFVDSLAMGKWAGWKARQALGPPKCKRQVEAQDDEDPLYYGAG